ncbi:MAG: glycosyltransferase family 9 protein [Deltaproteobacteria bacterium]|nr:MAG: glycosyltransferase family 9 protein [Deltaproteobacteria bacterium]
MAVVKKSLPFVLPISRIIKPFKRFDRITGPLLSRLMKRNASSKLLGSDEIGSILVIRPGGIGDAVLTLPMMNSLGNYFPKATIDVLAERRNAGVYRAVEPGPAVYMYDVDPLVTFKTLKAKQYDLIIDTEQFHYLSTIYANLLKPRSLIAFDTAGRGSLATHVVSYSDVKYEAQSFLDLAAVYCRWGGLFDEERPFLFPPSESLALAEELFCIFDKKPVVALAPSAGALNRIWALEKFEELAVWLFGKGYCLCLVGGADSLEAGARIASLGEGKNILDLCGKASLIETAAALSLCSACVSSDTGVLHLSYAVGSKVVGLFGSGLSVKWGPRGTRARVVSAGLDCSPCTRGSITPQCKNGFKCMDDISVESVIAALEELIS